MVAEVSRSARAAREPSRHSETLLNFFVSSAALWFNVGRPTFGAYAMTALPRLDNERKIRSPRGPQISCKSWLTEAPLRMLMNNLDAEVAERPQELVVYGGIGRAARDWQCFDRISAVLKDLGDDETLLVQSGRASCRERV